MKSKLEEAYEELAALNPAIVIESVAIWPDHISKYSVTYDGGHIYAATHEELTEKVKGIVIESEKSRLEKQLAELAASAESLQRQLASLNETAAH